MKQRTFIAWLVGVLVWIPITLISLVCWFTLSEDAASGRLETVREMAPSATADEILLALGRPQSVDRRTGTSVTTWKGYRGPLDWRRCLQGKQPNIRMPTRTWILLQTDSSTGAVTDIWWQSGWAWERVYPPHRSPGAPPGW